MDSDQFDGMTQADTQTTQASDPLMDRIEGGSQSTFFYRLEQAVWGAVEDRFVKLIETNSELMSKRFLEKLQNMVKEHGDVQR